MDLYAQQTIAPDTVTKRINAVGRIEVRCVYPNGHVWLLEYSPLMCDLVALAGVALAAFKHDRVMAPLIHGALPIFHYYES